MHYGISYVFSFKRITEKPKPLFGKTTQNQNLKQWGVSTKNITALRSQRPCHFSALKGKNTSPTKLFHDHEYVISEYDWKTKPHWK